MKCIFTALAFVFTLMSSASFADVVLTMGGDVNFSKNKSRVQPEGLQYLGKTYPWSAMTSGMAPLINGDFNFANIETVVTKNPNLRFQEKSFVFMSHTSAIEHLIHIGFNLFNLSNNHAYDYGHQGLQDTLEEMDDLSKRYPIVSTGIGTRPQNLTPTIFEKNGIKFAIAAISILNSEFKATETQVGLLNVASDKDFKDVIVALRDAPVDFRILSIHYGREGQVTLDKGQKERYRYAIEYGNVNVVIGHHPHVARPVEQWKHGIIFYSLGNYFMLGAADITRASSIQHDWGMFSRLYIEKDPADGIAKIEAVEVIPLTNTHFKATPLISFKAAERVRALNTLGEGQVGPTSVKLQIDSLSGKGYRCVGNMNSVRAKTMCASAVTAQ